MLEFILVVYILLAFVFPLQLLGLTLCLAIIYILYRKYLLLKYQPAEGKKILLLSVLMQAANTACCLLLSLAMAFGVHFLIIEYRYLFLFNLIFSFSVSLRWFDFTHRIFRYFIHKWLRKNGHASAVFVACIGLRKEKGMGMIPVYLDAGYLDYSGIRFAGVFSEQNLETNVISQVDKKGSEKIRVLFSRPPSPLHPDALLIVLKDQRYPFMSRPTRDKIFESLKKLRQAKPGGFPQEETALSQGG